MERLTTRTQGQISECFDCIEHMECYSEIGGCHAFENVLQKLKKYEDLEEQGKLIILPFSVGDTFWELNCVNEPQVYPRTAHSLQHCVYAMQRLGKEAFFSETEAEVAMEKALEEMEK